MNEVHYYISNISHGQSDHEIMKIPHGLTEYDFSQRD